MVGLGERAALARQLAAAGEENQCGDAAYAVTACNGRLCFSVQLGEPDTWLEARRGGVKGWCHHPARTAPFGPEVHHQWHLALCQVPVKCRG